MTSTSSHTGLSCGLPPCWGPCLVGRRARRRPSWTSFRRRGVGSASSVGHGVESADVVHWRKVRSSGYGARLTKGFGLSGDGDGWICFQSGQTELLGEDDALDLDVISRSCRVLYAKGGCTRCTVRQ